MAESISDEVNKFFPDEPFRGIKGSTGLVVLRDTDMPAVLVEVGFIDRSESLEVFSDESTLRRISEILAEGIDKYSKEAV